MKSKHVLVRIRILEEQVQNQTEHSPWLHYQEPQILRDMSKPFSVQNLIFETLSYSYPLFICLRKRCSYLSQRYDDKSHLPPYSNKTVTHYGACNTCCQKSE